MFPEKCLSGRQSPSSASPEIGNPARIRVFVYGTLLPGQPDHQRICRAFPVTSHPAFARGHLYALPVGYPALARGQDWISGALLEFDDPALLAAFDEWEDCRPGSPDSLYHRLWCPVFDARHQPFGSAWIYFMDSARIEPQGGQYLPGGSWLT